MRKSALIQVEGMNKYWGKPKTKLVGLVKKDMSIKEVTKSMTLDRISFLIFDSWGRWELNSGHPLEHLELLVELQGS